MWVERLCDGLREHISDPIHCALHAMKNFDASRASVRSSKEGGREGEGLETHFDASRASVARQRVEGRERVSRRVLTRLEPLSLVEGGWKGGRGLVLKVVALARHTL